MPDLTNPDAPPIDGHVAAPTIPGYVPVMSLDAGGSPHWSTAAPTAPAPPPPAAAPAPPAIPPSAPPTATPAAPANPIHSAIKDLAGAEREYSAPAKIQLGTDLGGGQSPDLAIHSGDYGPGGEMDDLRNRPGIKGNHKLFVTANTLIATDNDADSENILSTLTPQEKVQLYQGLRSDVVDYEQRRIAWHMNNGTTTQFGPANDQLLNTAREYVKANPDGKLAGFQEAMKQGFYGSARGIRSYLLPNDMSNAQAMDMQRALNAARSEEHSVLAPVGHGVGSLLDPATLATIGVGGLEIDATLTAEEMAANVAAHGAETAAERIAAHAGKAALMGMAIGAGPQSLEQVGEGQQATPVANALLGGAAGGTGAIGAELGGELVSRLAPDGVPALAVKGAVKGARVAGATAAGAASNLAIAKAEAADRPLTSDEIQTALGGAVAGAAGEVMGHSEQEPVVAEHSGIAPPENPNTVVRLAQKYPSLTKEELFALADEMNAKQNAPPIPGHEPIATEKPNAPAQQTANEVDVRQSPGNGQEVGGGNAQPQETAGTREQAEDEDAQATHLISLANQIDKMPPGLERDAAERQHAAGVESLLDSAMREQPPQGSIEEAQPATPGESPVTTAHPEVPEDFTKGMKPPPMPEGGVVDSRAAILPSEGAENVQDVHGLAPHQGRSGGEPEAAESRVQPSDEPGGRAPLSPDEARHQRFQSIAGIRKGIEPFRGVILHDDGTNLHLEMPDRTRVPYNLHEKMTPNSIGEYLKSARAANGGAHFEHEGQSIRIPETEAEWNKLPKASQAAILDEFRVHGLYDSTTDAIHTTHRVAQDHTVAGEETFHALAKRLKTADRDTYNRMILKYDSEDAAFHAFSKGESRANYFERIKRGTAHQTPSEVERRMSPRENAEAHVLTAAQNDGVLMSDAEFEHFRESGGLHPDVLADYRKTDMNGNAIRLGKDGKPLRNDANGKPIGEVMDGPKWRTYALDATGRKLHEFVNEGGFSEATEDMKPDQADRYQNRVINELSMSKKEKIERAAENYLHEQAHPDLQKAAELILGRKVQRTPEAEHAPEEELGTATKADEVAPFAVRKEKNLKTIYHGTDQDFKEFDTSKSADGTIWFTDNPSKITKGEVAANGKGKVIARQIDESKLKLGGWDETDKYSTDQLISMGYDGLKLPGDGETTYQIFNPEKLGESKEQTKTTGAQKSLLGERHEGSGIGSRTGSMFGDTSKGPANEVEDTRKAEPADPTQGKLFAVRKRAAGEQSDIPSKIEAPEDQDTRPAPTLFGQYDKGPTSIKNEVVDREREQRGLAPAMAAGRRGFGDVWDAAMREIDANPKVQDDLIASLKNKPRAITDREDALLLHRQADLRNQRQSNAEAIIKAKSDGNVEAANAARIREGAISDQLLEIYNVGKTSGTETGRGLNARKMMANEDFSLAAMETRKRAVNGGRKLTAEESAHIQELHAKIADTQKKFDDYVKDSENRIRRLQSKTATARIIKEASAPTARGLPSARRESILAGLRQRVASLSDTMGRQLAVRGESEPTSEQRTPESGVDWSTIPHISNDIQELARTFVQDGVRNRDKLIDSVHGELKDILKGITRRDTMDAISGYGKFSALSKDDVSVAFRDLKGQMQQVGKLEDMTQRGEAPRKTGVERREPSDEERRLIQQVNETKKKLGIQTTDPETQLKSAMDATKTRLQNQIKDLEYQIATKEKIVKTRTPAPEDAETTALKANRDTLRAEYDKIFNDKGLSEAQRVKAATAAAERTATEAERQVTEKELFQKRKLAPLNTPEIEAARTRRDAAKAQLEELRASDAGYQEMVRTRAQADEASRLEALINKNSKRIAEKDIATKEPEARPTSPEIEALRKQNARLAKRLQVMRTEAEPKADPATVALKAFKSRTLGRMAELAEKLATGDYNKAAAPKPIALDPEALKLKENLERFKQSYEDGLNRDRLNNRSASEKAQDAFVGWRRMGALSSPAIFGKLTAAGITRMGVAPVEEAVGGVLSHIPLLSRIAERAPIHGGASVKAEAKAITESITKGMPEAWKKLTTGKSNLDVLYGERSKVPQSWMDFFGNMHGALHEPVRQAAWARAFQKLTEFSIAHGEDPNNPVIQMRNGQTAFQEAQRSVFMQDNVVTKGYQAALARWEQPSAETGKPQAKGLATALRVAIPIVKIPTNLIGETMEYAIGSVTGSVRAGAAFYNGIENLRSEEADAIMRKLKKGSLGGAAMLLGYFGASAIGGYFQKGQKKDADDVPEGSVRIFDHNLPKTVLHNPLLEALQIGATMRRVADSRKKNTDEETQGNTVGAGAAMFGLLDEVPFMNEMLQYAKLSDPTTRAKTAGQIAGGIVTPSVVSQAAKAMDSKDRKPSGFWDTVKMGVPGLRQTVPEK